MVVDINKLGKLEITRKKYRGDCSKPHGKIHFGSPKAYKVKYELQISPKTIKLNMKQF